ncbi:MAG TPA: ATP-binding protein [Candidatus Pacearchaeota archaeon]|nr:ATP-binding protein [Candidatus Pacearchaeota archaeon]
MINRKIEKNIVENLFKGKVIIIYGARQVGKTTLVKKIADDYKGQSSYFNCDLISVQDALSIPEANRIKDFLGDHNIIILDEAQRIKNIGLTLKILIDTYPELQIIATGSSSFDLANEINEPLTGRKIVFNLFPLSVEEIMGDNGFLYIDSKLEKILRYGTYPDVFFSEDKEAASKLEEIASSYLFKDILSFDKIKKSSIIVKLLQLLALQVGSEVSYNELATKLGINRITVEKYIDILEQCFILFRINSFSRNLRNEISKSIKIYFYDLGVRNILIKNLNPLDIRNDAGFLWENFCILERMKRNKYNNIFANYYFWRTYNQKGINFIEERDGKLFAYEFKLNKEHSKAPSIFLETYKNSQYQTINRENYYKFLM